MSYEIYKNLAAINEMPRDAAIATFLACCGSRTWAERMADARPFAMLEPLFGKAEDVWFSLSTVEHLEAFAAHPEIGAQKSSTRGKAAEWSEAEQSTVADSDESIRRELAEINSLYHQRFGFIFIVCATGKTTEEMLAIAKARLRNSVQTELKIASEEQNKITKIRLTKLLEK